MRQLFWAGQDWSGHEGSAFCLPAASLVSHGLLGWGGGVYTQQTRCQGPALWFPQAEREMGSAQNKHGIARRVYAGCGIMQGGGQFWFCGGLALGKGIKSGLCGGGFGAGA